jgi:hypothetical protein
VKYDAKIRVMSSGKKRPSIQISKELAEDLVSASIKVNEVIETLEVQLDKQTMRRLKIGEKQYSKGQFKTAKTKEDIDKVLSR